MNRSIFTILMFVLCFEVEAQIGSAAGTLNQVHPDPAQKGFKAEYDDLRKTVNDLDKPKEKESKRESKLPSHKVESENIQND